MPKEVPGIAFLSGGQEDDESIENLNEINLYSKEKKSPWELTYSYGRGLQAAPLKIWNGKIENVESAQKEFEKRGISASKARQGNY